MKNVKNFAFLLSCIYVIALVVIACLSLLIPSFDDVGHLKEGCYWTDALVPFVQCSGFWDDQVVAYIANLPLRLLYLPLFGVAGVFRAPWIILHAAFIWAPLVYFVWHLIARRTN